MFGGDHRIISFLGFAPSLVRILERTRSPEFAIPFLMKGTLGWMPVSTGMPSWSGLLFPRNSVMESWTVATPHVFPWVLAFSRGRVTFHTHLLGSNDLLLSIVRNIHCFFFLYPWTCSSARGGPFMLSFNRREKLLPSFFCPSVASSSRSWFHPLRVNDCMLSLSNRAIRLCR